MKVADATYTVGICTDIEAETSEPHPGVVQITSDAKQHSAGSLDKAEIMAGSESWLLLHHEAQC